MQLKYIQPGETDEQRCVRFALDPQNSVTVEALDQRAKEWIYRCKCCGFSWEFPERENHDSGCPIGNLRGKQGRMF